MDRLPSQELQPEALDSDKELPDILQPSAVTDAPDTPAVMSPPDNTASLPSPDKPDKPKRPEGKRKRKSRSAKASPPPAPVSVGSWFVTLMCMNIPVIGWLYLIILAFSKSAGAKRGFAKAYLLYKFIFLLITLAILAVLVHYGMIYLDKLLAYMEML